MDTSTAATPVPDGHVYVAPLDPNDMGALRMSSFPVPGEAFFTAMVSEPEAVVSRLAGLTQEAWEARQTAIVADLANAPDETTRKAVKKRIPALVPARFRGSHRNNAECLGRQVVGHDFDHVPGATFVDAAEHVRRLLPDRFLVIHTTATERNADGTWRLRAYELLDREATPVEWSARVKPHMRRLGEGDANALDVARLLYLPIRTAAYGFKVYEGPRTRLEDLPEEASTAASPAPAPSGTRLATAPHGDATGKRRAAAALLGSVWPDKGRHRAQLGLAGALKRDGWAREDALEFLCDVCRAAGDEDRPKRTSTIEDTWATTTAVTGWPTLAEFVGEAVVNAARDLLDPHADDKREFMEIAARVASTAVANKAPDAAVAPTLPAVASTTAVDDFSLPLRWGGWDVPYVAPPYLLQGLIPAATVCTWYAEGGSVKSMAALALAISVARGDPWLGRLAVQKGRVAILDWEDGDEEFKRRRRFLTRDETDIPDLAYLYAQANLLDSRTWRFLAKQDLRLLIVDSLSAATPADVDENSREFVEPVRLAGKFAAATGCNVLYVHHANKTGGMRGFSGIRDQSDVVFRFEPVSETDDVKRMRMVCDKPGPQKKPAPVNLELSDAGLNTFEDEAHRLGRNARSDGDVREAILLALATKGPIPTKHKLAGEVGKRRESMAEELDALVATGEVVFINGVGYQLDNDARRRDRVLECLRSAEPFKTAAQLARASHVETRFVEGLERQGLVTGAQQGRLFEVRRDG